MAKRYRLLKDIPSAVRIIPAGTEFEEFEKSYANKEWKWWFAKEVVENNPEWFELIDNCFFDQKRLNERLQEIKDKEKEKEDEIRRLNHQAELLAEEKDYWYNRCMLAEKFIQKKL